MKRIILDCARDARYALRQFGRTPVLTAVVILSLALGIGANTAIFSAINTVMWRTLPVREPQQLAMLQWSAKQIPSSLIDDLEGDGGRSLGPSASSSVQSTSFSYPAYLYIRDHSHAFTDVAAMTGNEVRLNAGLPGRAEAASARGVSGNFFQMLGVGAALGRPLLLEDDAPSALPVSVISFSFWKDKLGSDPSVVGRTMTINGRSITIVGVAAEFFSGLEPGVDPDLWIPVRVFSAEETAAGNTNNGAEYINDPRTWGVQIVGRLASGAGESTARSETDVLLRQHVNTVAAKIPAADVPTGDVFSVSRGLDSLRNQFSKPLLVLMTAAGLVLLIACANVAALLLNRATARQREIAVRLSLGASAARLRRQLVTESVVLSLAGGVAGLFFAFWADTVLVALLSGGRTPIHIGVVLDARVLLFAIGVSLISGAMFGLAPALRAARFTIYSDVKQGTGASRSGMFRIGRVLVGAQIALCVMVVIGAGLFARTLHNLRSVDLGFSQDRLLLFTLRPGLNGYKDQRLTGYYEELQRRVESLPGVLAVGFSSRPPIGAGTGSSGAVIPGYTAPERPALLYRHQIGPDYFKSLGVPVVRGRAVGAEDAANAPPVVNINEKLASTYFKTDNPIGHIINFGSMAKPLNFTIVGVVKDVKYSQLRKDAPPTVYLPYAQTAFLSIPNAMTYEVRAGVPPSTIAKSIRRAGLELDPNVPIVDVKTQADIMDQAVFLERTIATLTGGFAWLALILACVGLYGTTSYAVSQQTRGIGIRMALGAGSRRILLGVIGETVITLAGGLALGVPLALAVTRYFRDELFGLQPSDPVTTIGAVILISTVAVLAGFIPARRASSVSPTVALRME